MSQWNSISNLFVVSDDEVEIMGPNYSAPTKKRKISLETLSNVSGLSKLPRISDSSMSVASRTKRSSGGSSKTHLSAALLSASRTESMSTTSALKAASFLSSSTTKSKPRPSISSSTAGPSRAARRPSIPTSNVQPRASFDAQDSDDGLPDMFAYSQPKKPIQSKGKQPEASGMSQRANKPKAPRASTGNIASSSKSRPDAHRRQTLHGGGLNASEAIEISSSDEGPVSGGPPPVIIIDDSDDEMELDPPLSSAPALSKSLPKQSARPKSAVTSAATQSSTGSKGKTSSNRTVEPLTTQRTSLTHLSGQSSGSTAAQTSASAPQSSAIEVPSSRAQPTSTTSSSKVKQPLKSIKDPKESTAYDYEVEREANIRNNDELLKRLGLDSLGGFMNPAQSSIPVKDRAKEIVPLGRDLQHAASAPPPKPKTSRLAPSAPAPPRPLFRSPSPPLPSELPSDIGAAMAELTQSFETLASSPIDKVVDLPHENTSSSKVVPFSTPPKRNPGAPSNAKSLSPGKPKQTAKKSAYRSSAFVPKPRIPSTPSEEFSEPLETSSTVASTSTKTTVTSVPIPGSAKRERTIETTVVQKTTTRTTDKIDDTADDDFFQTTTRASRSPSPGILRRPDTPKRRKMDEKAKDRPLASYILETASRRSKVTVEKGAAGSKLISMEDEELQTSVHQKARLKTRPAVVVTSLKEQTLSKGLPWHNPKDNEPVATPLDSSLADSMNRIIPSLASDPGRRAIFEEMIRTRDRGAPPIRILNDVDQEPCPPFEFDWTNEMLYGAGVPRKDKDLKGCGCRGPCDPYSKTCACIVRQNYWLGDIGEGGFAYGPDGRIMFCNAAVFECNEACGCNEDCQNRVVQNGRKVGLALRKTRSKGWGVFADQDIPSGRFIGVYSGELLTSAEAWSRGLLYDKLGRTYLFDLDFLHLRGASSSSDKPSSSRESSASGDSDKQWEPQYAVDAFHAGNHTRFLNHSCDPNVELYPIYTDDADIEKPLLCAFTAKDVKGGEELCFSYHNSDESFQSQEFEEEEAKIRGRCLCGAANCRGFMFNYSRTDDEEDPQGDIEDGGESGDAMDL